MTLKFGVSITYMYHMGHDHTLKLGNSKNGSIDIIHMALFQNA